MVCERPVDALSQSISWSATCVPINVLTLSKFLAAALGVKPTASLRNRFLCTLPMALRGSSSTKTRFSRKKSPGRG